MRITNSRDLGRYVRECRRRAGQTQAGLAAAAGVSRRWLADLEAGKPTVEVGLVFETLAALDQVFIAQSAIVPGEIDLDEHLATLMRDRSPARVAEPAEPGQPGGKT